MAEQSTEDAPRRESAARSEDGNRTIVVIIGVLLLLLLVGGLVAGGKKKKKARPDSGARAVLVPTEDRARSVVVPPCATGVAITPRNAPAQAGAPGATRLELPQGAGVRLVLIPRCPTPRGSVASDTGNLPSAAYVLPAGVRAPPVKAGTGTTGETSFLGGLRAQLIVPNQSQIRTVVVSACSAGPRPKSGSARTVVLSAEGQRADIAVAPAC